MYTHHANITIDMSLDKFPIVSYGIQFILRHDFFLPDFYDDKLFDDALTQHKIYSTRKF